MGHRRSGRLGIRGSLYHMASIQGAKRSPSWASLHGAHSTEEAHWISWTRLNAHFASPLLRLIYFLTCLWPETTLPNLSKRWARLTHVSGWLRSLTDCRWLLKDFFVPLYLGVFVFSQIPLWQGSGGIKNAAWGRNAHMISSALYSALLGRSLQVQSYKAFLPFLWETISLNAGKPKPVLFPF